MQLGDLVKDRITGLTGIVTGKHSWLYGCERVTVQPRAAKDGKPVEAFGVDAAQCEVIESGVIPNYDAMRAAAPKETPRPAGPRPEATRRSDPTR
jgi:hypothetical protein